jgi:hypothetical protein
MLALRLRTDRKCLSPVELGGSAQPKRLQQFEVGKWAVNMGFFPGLIQMMPTLEPIQGWVQ